MDCEYFALINIVYFGFTVRASYSNYFIVGVDLNWKNFCVDIAKEIHNSCATKRSVDELNLAWIEIFILFYLFLMV